MTVMVILPLFHWFLEQLMKMTVIKQIPSLVDHGDLSEWVLWNLRSSFLSWEHFIF